MDEKNWQHFRATLSVLDDLKEGLLVGRQIVLHLSQHLLLVAQELRVQELAQRGGKVVR